MELEEEGASCCQCKELVHNGKEAPLSWEVMLFFNIITHWATHCALAGGAVLTQLVHQARQCQHCCSPNQWRIQQQSAIGDVDFFVPMEPQLLRDFYGSSTGFSGQDDNRTFPQLLQESILPCFNSALGSKSTLGDLKVSRMINFENKHLEGPRRKKCSHNIHGISFILELEFEVRTHSKKFQIICLHTLPDYLGERWDSFVVRNFDIDIVKNSAIANVQYPLSPQVRFIDQSAMESFQGGNFVYTIQPCADFSVTFNRIRKYLGRGFHLKELKFDSRVTPYWKVTFINRFSAVFCKEWANDLLKEAILEHVATDTIAEQVEKASLFHVFQGHSELGSIIASYIWQPPSKQRHLLMKNAQRAVERYREKW